jgi:hypothetical protein
MCGTCRSCQLVNVKVHIFLKISVLLPTSRLCTR